ncbi:MAG: metal-dependent hydrolase, partial [Methanomassiliicoccales archaeon]|nr:metal-dependent hydrolase [Methanomassiliicoccales archaeon]
GDHLGDAIDISKRTGAPILGTYELATYAEGKGAKVLDGHIGGTVKTPICTVKMFNAIHSSSVSGGLLSVPSSFVISIDSVNIYHAGDTALFGDMALISDEFELDAALVPIGGHYTMDADDAVRAEALLRARHVIPMHYNTHGLILTDPKEFARKIADQGIGECVVLEPGGSWDVPSPGERIRHREPRSHQMMKA